MILVVLSPPPKENQSTSYRFPVPYLYTEYSTLILLYRAERTSSPDYRTRTVRVLCITPISPSIHTQYILYTITRIKRAKREIKGETESQREKERGTVVVRLLPPHHQSCKSHYNNFLFSYFLPTLRVSSLDSTYGGYYLDHLSCPILSCPVLIYPILSTNPQSISNFARRSPPLRPETLHPPLHAVKSMDTSLYHC